MATLISPQNSFDIPSYADTIRRRLLIEPLGGPRPIEYYLTRFPEEVYNLSPDSHLLRFLRVLLGPVGTGWLRENYLKARLMFEDHGIELFDLDSFYGNPFAFGRIFEEQYEEDPRGLLPRDKWNELRSKDAAYRNRALDFLAGARAGNTPEGMRFVARSGLGHEVEIIENYRYLFDIHSDDTLGLGYYGKTASTEEMIVLPRQEIGRSEEQTITIKGHANDGFFALSFNDDTRPTPMLEYDSDAATVQSALELLPNIGVGNVEVLGGPGPDTPWVVRFTRELAGQDVPQITTINNLLGPEGPPPLEVTTSASGVEAADEVVYLSARDNHHLQDALSRIKPVTTIVTVDGSPGLQSRQLWSGGFASSEYTEVLKYVTGRPDVPWPPIEESKYHWIVPAVEVEAPRRHDDLQFHYASFSEPINVVAFTEREFEHTAIRVKAEGGHFRLKVKKHDGVEYESAEIEHGAEAEDVKHALDDMGFDDKGTDVYKYPDSDTYHIIIDDDSFQFDDSHKGVRVSIVNVDLFSSGEVEIEDEDYSEVGPSQEFLSFLVGRHSEDQRNAIPFFRRFDDDFHEWESLYSRSVDFIDIDSMIDDDIDGGSYILLDGVYPADYTSLPGIENMPSDDGLFWSSQEREHGEEYIEFDFGEVKQFNYLRFETIGKPFKIEVEYDILDQSPRREYRSVNLDDDITTNSDLFYSPEGLNPWVTVEFAFNGETNRVLQSRFIRLKFERREDVFEHFLKDASGLQKPYSIEVKNFRAGIVT